MSDPVSALLSARLTAQKLARPARQTPAGIVGWFGAMQAQEYGPARWAIGQRATNLTDAQIAAAFDAGDILRTHAMRPTWHFVAPADIRWLQALTGPRVRAASASVLRANALDARLLTRAKDAIARALEGSTFLTRQELRAVLDRARIPAAGQRLAYIVMDAELDALICSGPRRGKQFTYALVDERASRAPAMDRDEALVELARRFFRSHGPATVRDFVWWSGLKVSDARTAIDAAKLTRWDAGGMTYWMTGRRAPVGVPSVSVYLLPIYDEYVNAYRDRAVLFSTASASRPVFMHYLIVDGRYAGTWRPDGDGPGRVAIEAGIRMNVAQRAALASAIGGHAAFYGRR